MNCILEFQNTSKTFGRGEGKTYALKGIDLRIKKGTSNVILGPSGSGKSTLLNLASLMDTPTHGEILIKGEVTSKMSKSEKSQLRRDEIGIIYQRDNLLPYLTILENVMVSMVDKDEKKAMQIIKTMGLTETSKFPSELSMTHQQRVALSRALINKPSIVLTDEPTGELNAEDTEKFMNLIKDMGEEFAVLTASNNQDIGKYFENVYTLKDGLLIENES